MNKALIDSLDARLGTPEFDADPLDTLRQLQQEDPVHWSDAIGGWLVTRFDDVVSTFKQVEYFSNEGRLAKASAYLPAEAREQFRPFEDHYNTKGILHSDPPDHTRLRALVLTAFNPRVVEAMRPRIESIVNDLLDKAVPNGGMEVIDELAWALPSTVLSDLFGAPPEARPLFRKWADDILAFQGVNKPTVEILATAQQALLDAKAYLLEMINERRREPTDDLISHLVSAEAEGEKLSEPELLSTCITLMGAGQETTTALVGNGLYLLLSNPDAWDRLRRDPSMVPTAVEEFVRFESPIPRQPRLIKQEVELGGKTLKVGDIAFQMLNIANRDPEKFENPDTFDIERKPNRHIGFGLGPHFCVGAPLSRLEGQILFTTILERFPNMTLVDPVPHWNPVKRNSRVLKSLDVRF
ncbi:MAG: cytochrome P450 [Actinomycetota bacterium]|nr:cytochrome P450 [Actinomycetota bacterium]